MLKDVFLCHASADKAQYVRPFCEELALVGVSHWVDEAEIAWGDSITSKINDALRKSRRVIVFLSAAFLGRPWTEKEMSSALRMEIDDGIRFVLPIVIGDPKILLAPYPLLRDKAYATWDEGVPGLASRLKHDLDLDKSDVAQMTASVLRNYFQFVSDRDEFSAYTCFSLNYQHHTSVGEYRKVFAKTRKAVVASINLLNSTRDRSYSEVTVIATDCVGGNEIWRGVVEFSLQESDWKIDTMKGLKRVH